LVVLCHESLLAALFIKEKQVFMCVCERERDRFVGKGGFGDLTSHTSPCFCECGCELITSGWEPTKKQQDWFIHHLETLGGSRI